MSIFSDKQMGFHKNIVSPAHFVPNKPLIIRPTLQIITKIADCLLFSFNIGLFIVPQARQNIEDYPSSYLYKRTSNIGIKVYSLL